MKQIIIDILIKTAKTIGAEMLRRAFYTWKHKQVQKDISDIIEMSQFVGNEDGMPTKQEMLYDVAARIKANPADLDALISLESNWNPEAYNKSGAIGLIQFMPQTLKDFGLLSNELDARVPATGVVSEEVKQLVRKEFLAKYPTVQAQLYGPVLQYFKRYMPFPTKQSLYLSVFYPKYRNADPATVLPTIVQKQNPGVTTVGDYVALIESKNKFKNIAETGGKIGLVALAAVAGYFAMTS